MGKQCSDSDRDVNNEESLVGVETGASLLITMMIGGDYESTHVRN